MTLDYDIIIATANRPEILRVSLPSMMRQIRPPKSLIIADASNDHEAVVRTVREATAGAPFEVQVFQAAKGASPQRNAGLAYSTSPIIFFPDDDSVWFEDVGENVMRIYERDTDNRIGGVGQAESFESPLKITQEEERARASSPLKTLKYRLSALRHKIVNRWASNPLHLCGLELLARHAIPAWLPELLAIPIERQIGFRMSWRADSVRRCRFDEDLRLPRSLWEDFSLSFAVLQNQILVEATNARVYHHRFGGGRGNGLENGAEQLLNICYLVCKFSPPRSRARIAIKPYARLFAAEAMLRSAASKYERDKLRGMRRARREFNSLIDSPPDELTARYREAIARCVQP
ncbi:MAG TPA: glycosyltransferase family A protein [Lacipirellulaceae bacterium]|nr:glycosyltransferase family A protein [Lacipirellulaceae bacterium]